LTLLTRHWRGRSCNRFNMAGPCVCAYKRWSDGILHQKEWVSEAGTRSRKVASLIESVKPVQSTATPPDSRLLVALLFGLRSPREDHAVSRRLVSFLSALVIISLPERYRQRFARSSLAFCRTVLSGTCYRPLDGYHIETLPFAMFCKFDQCLGSPINIAAEVPHTTLTQFSRRLPCPASSTPLAAAKEATKNACQSLIAYQRGNPNRGGAKYSVPSIATTMSRACIVLGCLCLQQLLEKPSYGLQQANKDSSPQSIHCVLSSRSMKHPQKSIQAHSQSGFYS